MNRNQMDNEQIANGVRHLEFTFGILSTIKENDCKGFEEFIEDLDKGFNWWPSSFRQSVQLVDFGLVPFVALEVTTDLLIGLDDQSAIKFINDHSATPMLPAFSHDRSKGAVGLRNSVPLFSYSMPDHFVRFGIESLVRSCMHQQLEFIRRNFDNLHDLFGGESLNRTGHPQAGTPNRAHYYFNPDYIKSLRERERGTSNREFSVDDIVASREVAKAIDLDLSKAVDGIVGYSTPLSDGKALEGEMKCGFSDSWFGPGVLIRERIPLKRIADSSASEMVTDLDGLFTGESPNFSFTLGRFFVEDGSLFHSVFLPDYLRHPNGDSILKLCMFQSVIRARVLGKWLTTPVFLLDRKAKPSEDGMAYYDRIAELED